MAKVWVLDTGTKGTGAEMVPLEKVLTKPAPEAKPALVREQPRPRAPRPPEPREPRRFKVVEVISEQVLTEGADVRATLALLRRIRSVVDVRVYAWQPKSERWRLLTVAEQKAMWKLRNSRY